jgi:hypothetical protein
LASRSRLAAAEYTVTYAAYQAGLLPNWSFSDILYHAVLSTNGHDVRDRVLISAPIYNMNGDLVADNASGLWNGLIQNPVGYDEYDQPIIDHPGVWTGTNVPGVWSGSSAGAWDNPNSNATIGTANGNDATWLSSAVHSAINDFD